MTRRNIHWYIAFLMLLSLPGCTSVKHSTSANQNSRVSIVVIHFTTADFESSLQILTEPSSNPVSSHYLIPEPDDKSYGKSRLRTSQLVDEDRRAWHAGSSYWGGKTAINDQSIGIEIVNRSWCQDRQTQQQGETASVEEFCFFPDFPDGQIALLVDLLEDILERHPDIKPTDIVGHSDVAPGRKVDPGPRFPWQRLASLGFGAWYDDETVLKYWNRFLDEPLPLVNVQKALAAYGYQIEPTGEYDRQTGDVLQSFQMHFRSHEVTRRPSVETAATLFALIEKYYPEQLEELLKIAPVTAIGEDTSNQSNAPQPAGAGMTS